MARTKEESENFRKGLIDNAKNKLQNLTDSTEFKKYLKQMSSFHHYSFSNINLILSQKENATLVAGYKSWEKNFNRNVKKGSKAIYIQAPIIKKLTEEEKEKYKTKKDTAVVGFRLVPVFDVSDTAGEHIMTAHDFIKEIDSNKGQELFSFDKLEKLANHIRIELNTPVHFKNLNNDTVGGFYSHQTKDITINTEANYTKQLQVLIHELTNSLIHDKDFGEYALVSQGLKEVHAESVAFLCMEALGIDTSQTSIGYIATWGKDITLMEKGLKDITDTFNYILDIINASGSDIEKIQVLEKTCQNLTNYFGDRLENTNYLTHIEYFNKQLKEEILFNLKFMDNDSIEKIKNDLGEKELDLISLENSDSLTVENSDSLTVNKKKAEITL